ncbi:tail fiber assembly protein [Kluyvera sp. Awk 3]|uniref:tail fiber assembly protein n=1 Tax=Kluyvera sp. Awk 3 TaxID=2963956 RepID=UPI0023043C5C|nr:tail fiber assembly protein [Kluyvera sp. Awk 3]MDA8490135.1 tail fiber assembly protein [Kluyvera sp. Awk 3]
MKKTIKYANGLFYPSAVIYKDIPADAIEVSEESYLKAMSRAPDETFSVDNLGEVTIHPAPTISPEQQIEQRKSNLKKEADYEIEWRQDAVDYGIATVEETNDLNEWRAYRVKLMRVSLTNPEFPIRPEV